MVSGLCPVVANVSGPAAPFRGQTAKCPRCGSLERHRLAWLYLTQRTDLFDPRPKRVLHVAPEQCFEGRLRARLGDGYLTADMLDPHVMERMDITRIRVPRRDLRRRLLQSRARARAGRPASAPGVPSRPQADRLGHSARPDHGGQELRGSDHRHCLRAPPGLRARGSRPVLRPGLCRSAGGGGVCGGCHEGVGPGVAARRRSNGGPSGAAGEIFHCRRAAS